jgi:hypothetical protein
VITDSSEQSSVGDKDHLLELWTVLAQAGPKATAEALSSSELDLLHVETPLDEFIANEVRQGRSIVLTGNAGDGKTHMLRRIRPVLEEAGAEVLEDATARMRRGDVRPVLDDWRRAFANGKPFCVAANEYPLYQLRRAAEDFAPLGEVDRQCRNWLAYGSPSSDEAAMEQIVVIDLSLRNPLARQFSEAVFDKLLAGAPAGSLSATGSTAVACRNRPRLADERVRVRLRALFDRLIARGHRATVRELWILACRSLFGTSGHLDVQSSDWYSELLFAPDSRFGLIDALGEVDPAECSHPQLDLALETRSPALRGGWFFGEPVLPPHPDLSSELFSTLKRVFYFEHERGEEAFALIDPDAQEFSVLLNGQGDSGRSRTRGLVDAVNAAYCPVPFNGREYYLYLWTGHRFHEQPSRSFVAADRLPSDGFSVEVPRLPTRLEGAFDYQPDHVVLTAHGHRDRPRLKIDFPLFRTLRRLGRGLPRKLIPERDIHRLDGFLEKLGAGSTTGRSTLWSVHLENLEVLQIGLSDDRRAYQTVVRL